MHVAGKVYTNAFFGAGSGPIFLDDVQCTSSASQLLECSSRPILSHNCLHSADAGVGCEGIFKSLTIAAHVKAHVVYSFIHFVGTLDDIVFIGSCSGTFVFHLQLLVQLVNSDWPEVILQMKAELRSASTISGVLCVMTTGEVMMLLSCVGNWDTLLKVNTL